MEMSHETKGILKGVLLAILCVCLIMGSIIYISGVIKSEKKEIAAASEPQKYRFLQRCGDNVTAEYVATEKLPVVTVCGEEPETVEDGI